MATRMKNGDTTVILDDGLERFARSLLSAAETETLRVMEEEGAKLAADARAAWYGPNGVHRETGLSGDIVVNTTFDRNKSVARVSIGSSDTRKAGKSGKPVVVFVHRPRRLATRLETCDRLTWYATAEGRRGPIFRTDEDNKVYQSARGVHVPESALRYTIHVGDEKAGDGKFLLAELVRKPGKALTTRIAERVVHQIADKVGR